MEKTAWISFLCALDFLTDSTKDNRNAAVPAYTGLAAFFIKVYLLFYQNYLYRTINLRNNKFTIGEVNSLLNNIIFFLQFFSFFANAETKPGTK